MRIVGTSTHPHELPQGAAQRAGLLARARDGDALAKERRVSNQFSGIPQLHHIAKHRTAGALKPVASTCAAMSASVPRKVCCRPVVPQRTSCHRHFRRRAVLHQADRDHAHPLHTHEHHFRSRRRRELPKIQRTLGLRRILVPGENGQLRRVIAMRHRDAA